MMSKDALPRLIRAPLGRANAYVRRMRYWADVARYIKGESPADKLALASAVMKSPLTSLRDLSHWQNPIVGRDCQVLVEGFGRFAIRGGSEDLFIVLPTREPGIVKAMRQLLRPGDIFIDGGANIGIYSVLGSKLVGPKGQVIAVEMMPETAAILRGHLEDNCCSNVTVVEQALSDVPGQTAIATIAPGKSGQASLVIEQEGERVKVSTTTLEELLSDIPSLALLKLDLEGFELRALEGLGKSLSKVGAIVFEDKFDGEIAVWLRKRGYSVERLDGANSLARR
jgi:FkbM family methyltransferase